MTRDDDDGLDRILKWILGGVWVLVVAGICLVVSALIRIWMLPTPLEHFTQCRKMALAEPALDAVARERYIRMCVGIPEEL